MATTQYVLEMTGIRKSFPGVLALDDAALFVLPGTVHALMGENGAGKSTLMKCLFGLYKKDAGAIKFRGEEVDFRSPQDALTHGVAMVHQELEQVRERNIMDNLWLGRFPNAAGFVNEKKMYEETKKIFERIGINLDPRTTLKKLPVADRQMVEIAKAVSYNATLIVLDEPTSSLTETEVSHLFKIIRQMKAEGTSFIYISHKLDEIKLISDDVTIMRDSRFIHSAPTESLSINQIIAYMVGRELTNLYPPKTNTIGDVILRVNGLTQAGSGAVQDASFELRKGEILGIAGLLGARKTELVETLFGIRRRLSGEVLLHGKAINNQGSADAIKNGFALCTEERRFNGIFPGLTVRFNTTIANIRAYSRLGFLNEGRLAKDTQYIIDGINVKTPSQTTRIRSLSGGNQQKVVFGRWLLTKPEILMLDDPTRGIDVGAKYEIYQLIINLAAEGKGILFVSSEMSELLGVCDRILVMSNGRVAGEVDLHKDLGALDKKQAQETIMKLCARFL